ncbi:putative Beta-3-deoxy-D-manno-oct-2-ulosonic acid transferase [Vibrio chagasii]|nr:putative Beta-3-deoxy-D-manno-oct-2-ulosonic acid transferase [Vibrio chagasii]
MFEYSKGLLSKLRLKTPSQIANRKTDFFFAPDRNNQGRKRVFAFKVASWKREYISEVYSEYDWVFIGNKKRAKSFSKLIANSSDPVFLFWGVSEHHSDLAYAQRKNIPIWRMEDGFLRSIGLGCHHNLPSSLVIDKTSGIYFDPTSENGLSLLISSVDRVITPEHHILFSNFIDSSLSKYNSYSGSLTFEPTSDSVLVIGQVEDDSSILKGGCGYDNLSAVMKAISDNPDSHVYYKPHPDVISGKRLGAECHKEIEKGATIISEPLPLVELVSNFDRVYVISSLVGLEALFRGATVTVLGKPFYAGWGLTDDRNASLVTDLVSYFGTRELALIHLFRSVYIDYPDYFNLSDCKKTSFSKVMNEIFDGVKRNEG